jgi:hypothetical protein
MFINPFSTSTNINNITIQSTSTSINTTTNSTPTSRKHSQSSLNSISRSRINSIDTINQNIIKSNSIPTTSITTTTTTIIPCSTTVDFSRRTSVDNGVFSSGYHRHGTGASVSRSVRDAVGPDAGDKEEGFVGTSANGGRNRL